MLDVEGSIISNSRHSVKSVVSSRSKLQNAKVMRLVAEHKLRKLKERQELERARKDLEMKQELFEQSAEVEEAIIVESVLQEALNEETTSTLFLMSLNDRVSLLRKFKLCYNCLKGNHFSST